MTAIPVIIGNKGNSSGFEDVGGKRKRVTRAEAFTTNRVVILSDSICQLMINCLFTEVQCVHGGRMSNVVQYLRQGTCWVDNVEGVILAYGSNDLRGNIHFSQCADEIVGSLRRAVKYIRHLNPTARIGVSGILPRPRDITAENTAMIDARVYTNVVMREFCKLNNVSYFKSETTLKNRDIEPPIFKEDGLHLTTEGTSYYQLYLEGKACELIGPPSQKPRKRQKRN
jgi:hypothetical protein